MIILRESGFNTGQSFDEICAEIEEAGLDSPREMGYTEAETRFYGAVYARSALLDEGEEWDTDAPYWEVHASDIEPQSGQSNQLGD